MANETFKIEIPIEVNDMTSGGAERATKTLDAFGKAVEKAEAQLNRLAGTNLTIGDMEQINSAITAFDRLGPLMNTSRDSFNQLRETISSCSEAMSQINTDYISTEAMERYTAANNEAAEALEALKRAYQETETASENYVRIISDEKSSLDDIKAAALRVKNAEEQLVTAENRATEATQELTEATQEVTDESETWEYKTVTAVNSVASVLAAAGIVQFFKEIASAVMECAEVSEEYGASLAKLSTIADTSSVDMGTLKSEITDLSNEIGESVNDLSEASYQAISAGIDTANAVSFTETATKLAIGGFTEATTAVDVLTTAINAYGKSAEDAENIANMLVMTQNLGKTTVDELSQSVGKVIPIAAAYNVEMDNLMSAYAQLTKGGIATAEAGTYLKSMLNELGDSGSEVSAVLSKETGQTFAQLSEAGNSLGDVLAIIGESVDNDATKFNELWSSQEAGVGALSLLNAGSEEYNETLKAMQTSAGATEEAFAKMDSTAADAKEDMINAANNLKIAVGDNLSGAFEGVYSGGTKLLTLLTNLAEEHPILTRTVLTFTGILGATATAFAVAAAAEAVYTTATTVATGVTTALGVAINTALWPFVGIAVAIAGVVSVLSYFSQKAKEARDVSDHLTASSQRQKKEIDELQAQYDELAAAGKTETTQAKELKAKIDELTTSFENGKTTIGEYASQTEELKSSLESINSTYDEAISQNNKLEESTRSTATQLMKLADKPGHSSAEIEYMQELADMLNESYNLDVTVDINTGEVNVSREEIYRQIKQKADEAEKQAAEDSLVQLTGEFQSSRDNYNATKENARLAKEDYYAAEEQWKSDHPIKAAIGKGAEMNWDSDLGAKWSKYEAQHEAASEAATEYNARLDEMREKYEVLGYSEEEISQIISDMEEAADKTNELGDSTDSVTEKTAEMTSAIDTAAAAYKTYYSDLKESFENQYSLFDTAKADADATIKAAQAALDSQLTFWTNYADNVSVLKNQSATDLGITQTQYDELMAYAQSGTEEAAGFAASLAQAVESGNTETIQNLANTMTQVKTAQENAAAETADWKANLTAELEQFNSDMQTLVDDLDKSSEAYTAAENIMTQYALALNNGREAALTEARTTAAEIASILNSVTVTGSTDYGVNLALTRDAKFHAEGGLMTSPHIGVVAEDGPEAIIPLSASKSDRGLDLWLQAGRYLGVSPYADGGVVGDDSEAVDIPISGSADGGISISVTMPEINIEYNGNGESLGDRDSLIELINEKCKEAGEDLIMQLSTMLKQIFSNMPVKGSA